MENMIISKLAYIAMTVLLSFIAGSFFLLNPLRKNPDKQPILNSFSLFFIFSGLGFLSFILTIENFQLLAVALNNICFLVSFLYLKQALIIRKTKRKISILSDKNALMFLLIIPTINIGLFWYNSEWLLARTAIVIIALWMIVLSTFRYVPLNRKNINFGERVMINTLKMSMFFMSILIVVLLSSNNLYLYLSVLTVTFTLLLASLLGAIQTVLMGDLSSLYKQESITDLTGMYNRRYFVSRSNELIHLSKRKPFTTSVVLLDVDDFKNINDIYGHDVGDEVLKLVSSVIKRCIRESDIAARIGGEEFCLTMPYTDAVVAMAIAERIREALQDEAIVIGSKEIRCKASFGVCEVTPDVEGCTITHALKQADNALYTSKLNGKNRVSVFGFTPAKAM